MLFSFTAPRSGRIIQAYHDGRSLVIRKSRLFDFSTLTTAPFQLFMRYLACTPVGYTEKFPADLELVNEPTKESSKEGMLQWMRGWKILPMGQ